ncbi:undecaprenyl-diphosphatase UppP [Alkalicoccus urumqiensis]|uniref:Undecaprenyl-diphosphatase n=1 Tax=Alkalicoccus urumqiensis TaxID=1548213 RepID=A0A2P6MKG2_ALKUR|nr:undecaprenyl-diphosphatase UppP [Alkalicoccus urumqiensis]PRO66758.1 undecaprenyl-diphosphatase UppP [Alkalicoccus urumqiensis]
MTWIEALIFGVVQGITEFLPISSTAHIVIVQLMFGYSFPGLSFEIFLHLASVLAVLLYFWKDMWEVLQGFFRYIAHRDNKDRTKFFFGVYILTATVITGGLGAVLSDTIGEGLKSPYVIGSALILTGFALVFIERFHRTGRKQEKDMTFLDAVIVGLGQTLAVFPGISRSGATLVVGLLRGLDKDTAVRYSFLLAIPVILGSTVLGVSDFTMEMVTYVTVPNLILSFVVTFIFSMLGIIWLIDFLKKSKLIYFAIYCFAAGILVMIFIDPSVVVEV